MIHQSESSECGHACVAMISHYFGHQLDLHDIRTVQNTSNLGVTLQDINELCERLHFVTRPIQVPLEEFHLIKCPAILHWNMNHFVVLKSVKKNKVVIHDPALGIRHCNFEEVSKSFTGIVLEIEKSMNFKVIREDKTLTLYQLLKSFHGIKKCLLFLMLLSFAIEGIGLLNPLFLQYITDNVIGYSEKSNLYVIAFGFFILIILQIFTEYIRGNMVVYLTNNLTEQFSSNVVLHLLKLPLAFFEKRHRGDLQSKFQSIDLIQKKISTDFVNTALDGFMLVVNFLVMALYSIVLTTMVTAALGLCMICRYGSYQRLKKHTELSIQQHAKAATVFLETVQGMMPIKTFLKERTRFNTWRNSYIDSLNADITVSKMNVLYQVVHQALFHMEHILVVCVGVTLVLANQFTLGMLMAFLAYRQLFVSKASSLMQHLFDYKLIGIQLNRLGDILYQLPEKQDQRMTSTKKIGGALRLENVGFKYNQNEQYILKSVSMDIAPQEKVVLIGPSGIGKSTLLKIMAGLLEKTEGEIYVDNIPLLDFGLQNYRSQIAAVMQEDTLLTGSLMENIAFFDESMDIDHIQHVARLAFIDEYISKLPMGYETHIGDMGSILSGGQKQRILLARALYKEPRILFLDEASSHLDAENEHKINQSLKLLNITQVIIAHRQETINAAHRVIDLSILNHAAL